MTPDVRCAANLYLTRENSRCQLYIGHDGDHALLALHDGDRSLVQWSSARVRTEPFGADVPAQLPWAPGCPWLVEKLNRAPRLRPARGLRAVARDKRPAEVGTDASSADVVSARAARLHIA